MQPCEATFSTKVSVGVRELKNRLSEYLRMVRRGEEILVTDRGEPVAELRQPLSAPCTAAYLKLKRRGHAGRGDWALPTARIRIPPFVPARRYRTAAVR